MHIYMCKIMSDNIAILAFYALAYDYFRFLSSPQPVCPRHRFSRESGRKTPASMSSSHEHFE